MNSPNLGKQYDILASAASLPASVPFRAGREGYASFRVPAVVSGTTWHPRVTVDGLPAACSDLVRIDADTVGLLYETGDFGAYERIVFRRVPVTRLT